MSTTNEPQPESASPVPEELVAYLDGELSPDECRRVEERLAADEDYRQQLRELDQAWEALGALPTTAVDDDFARTTIEMVVLAARQEQDERANQLATAVRSRRRWWIAAGIAAALASFAAARWLLPDGNARLLDNLPIIAQIDLLQQIQDVGFLRRLNQEIPLEQLVADESAVHRKVEQLRAAAAPSRDLRRQWIESLSTDDRANLATQAKQFEALQPRERERLRKLEQEIAAAPDVDQLQHTLAAYAQWLTRRSSGERSDLRTMTADDLLRRIRETVKQEQRQAAWRLALSDDDEAELRNEIYEIYNERKDEFERSARRRGRDDRPRGPNARSEAARALIVTGWALFSNYDIDDKTQRRIIRDLSDEAQKHLEQLRSRGGERGGERRVKQQLWHWMHDAMRPKREPGDVEKYFAESLDSNERERLLNLPRDQMEAELEQMYLGSRFGLQGREWLGAPGPAGRGWPPNGAPPQPAPQKPN